MNQRQHVFSGIPWEEKIGYSRAVRVGANVWVAGTVAVSRLASSECLVEIEVDAFVVEG